MLSCGSMFMIMFHLHTQNVINSFRVVKAGFSEKRKQIHNSLTHGLHYKNEQIRLWLQKAHIEASRRAETLSIEEWMNLWKVIDEPIVAEKL